MYNYIQNMLMFFSFRNKKNCSYIIIYNYEIQKIINFFLKFFIKMIKLLPPLNRSYNKNPSI